MGIQTPRGGYLWPDGSHRATPPPQQQQGNQPGGLPGAQPAQIDYLNPDNLATKFAGTPFASSPTFKNILTKYTQAPSSYSGYGGDTARWAEGVAQTLNQYASTFAGMFKDKVGRDPTQNEYDQFFQHVVQTDAPWTAPADFTKAGEETKGFLGDFYTKTAQDEAKKKIEDTSNQAVAPGGAFDQWQKAYMGSVDTVQNSLTDYQNRLMEKIRPQLLTSLQSQGLLNTGALNEAFAGQAADMASTGSNYVAGLRGQAAQDIANQKYQIQSNPTNYTLNNAYASVPNMVAGGQNALGNIWNSYLSNQNYQQQLGLYNAQQQNQPSMLQQYGGMILGGAAAGLGQGLASYIGKTPTPIKTPGVK